MRVQQEPRCWELAGLCCCRSATDSARSPPNLAPPSSPLPSLLPAAGVAGLFAFLRRRYPEIVEQIAQQPEEVPEGASVCDNL